MIVEILPEKHILFLVFLRSTFFLTDRTTKINKLGRGR